MSSGTFTSMPMAALGIKLGNESAFPLALLNDNFHHFGLTKRELFAMMAMQGMLAGGANLFQREENAALAVLQADALLAELAKESK